MSRVAATSVDTGSVTDEFAVFDQRPFWSRTRWEGGGDSFCDVNKVVVNDYEVTEQSNVEMRENGREDEGGKERNECCLVRCQELFGLNRSPGVVRAAAL